MPEPSPFHHASMSDLRAEPGGFAEMIGLVILMMVLGPDSVETVMAILHRCGYIHEIGHARVEKAGRQAYDISFVDSDPCSLHTYCCVYLGGQTGNSRRMVVVELLSCTRVGRATLELFEVVVARTALFKKIFGSR